jgi:hypothetical protein
MGGESDLGFWFCEPVRDWEVVERSKTIFCMLREEKSRAEKVSMNTYT